MMAATNESNPFESAFSGNLATLLHLQMREYEQAEAVAARALDLSEKNQLPQVIGFLHIAHRVGVRAEARVDLELMKYARKVLGKARLLYQLAKAATGQPDGVVRDVIYPAVGEKTLEDIICEAEAAENYEHRVKWVTRASYSHHYRRIVPALLEVLSFQCNNDVHRPVMVA